MGDRTPIEASVYSCPPERVNAVLEVFEEFGLGHEFVLPGDPVPGPASASRQRRLELGRRYIHSGSRSAPARRSRRPCPPTQHGRSGRTEVRAPRRGAAQSLRAGRVRRGLRRAGSPVFISEEIDRLVERTDADRVQLGHLTGGTWGMALEQLDKASKGIVIPSDAPPGSAPLQAVALNQLAAGPSRWMPADAPGQARSATAPDR